MKRVPCLDVSIPGRSPLAEHAASAVPRHLQKGGGIMRERRLLLLGCLLVATLLLMGATGGAAPLVYTPDGNGVVSVNVIFKSTPHEAERSFLLATAKDVRVKYLWHLIPAANIKVPQASLQQVLAKVNADPRVRLVEPDGIAHACAQTIPWGVSHINAPALWAAGNKGTGVKVAVIDTGIDYTHPDLAANYHGGYDYVNSDSNPMDDNGHGTHVSGTVAAVDNTIGVVGVAPEAWLYGVKVLDSGGSGYYSWIVSGIQWAVTNGMRVCNMSLGGSSSDATLQSACQAAYDAGVLICAASGNSNGPLLYPAAYSSTFAVGATDSTDTRASFSCYGPELDVVAPGVDILSTTLGGGYQSGWNGTSMATPHVSGVAALMVRAGYSGTSNLMQRMRNTAHDLGASGRDDYYGWGLVDAHAADVTTGEDSYEVDDTSGQAKLITVNAAAQNRNNYSVAHKLDYAYFSATAGSQYTIQTLNLGANADTTLTLYNSSLTQLAFDDDSGPGLASLIIWTCPTTGTYYVMEAPVSDSRSGDKPKRASRPGIRTGATATYDLQVLGPEPNEDSYEVDDTSGQAKLITVNAAVQNRNNYSVTHKLDWAYFSATAGSQYTIQTLNLGTNADTVLYLYNSSLTQLAYDDDSGPGLASLIIWTCPTTGTYYVMEAPYSDSRDGAKAKRASRPGLRTGTAATYDLQVLGPASYEDSYEVDDTSGAAKLITVNAAVQNRNNYSVTHKLDWAYFSATVGGQYTLQTSNLGTNADTTLTLYNSSLTWLAYDDDGGGGLASRIVWTCPTTGTYYVMEAPYSDSRGGAKTKRASRPGIRTGTAATYDLQVLGPDPNEDVYEVDDASGQAKLITVNAAVQHRNNYSVTHKLDWAYFSGTAGRRYQIQTLNLGTNADTTLTLYNSSLTQLAYDDDSGPGLASLIIWTCPTTGTYYVKEAPFSDSRDGPKPKPASRPGIRTGTAATYDLQVLVANNPPVANDDFYETNANQVLGVPAPGVLGNDTDADGDTLTAYPVPTSPPQHGSLILNRDGSFYYTPNTGFSGEDTFAYYADDGRATGSGQQSVAPPAQGKPRAQGGEVRVPSNYAWVHITVRARLQPDLWVRNRGETSYVGNNIYNPDGTNQTKSQSVEANVWATYYFQLYNDGDLTESFRLKGQPTSVPTGWLVRYYIDGQGEKTTDFIGAGYVVSSLAPGAAIGGSVMVLMSRTVAIGASLPVLVTATSETDAATWLDTVKAVTRRTSGGQPDLWIRNQANATYIGDNIYNSDGAGQTKTQVVPANVWATYYFRLYNDSSLVGSSYRLTGPAAPSGWVVKYYIDGQGEKTADFTNGVGYLVQSLAPAGAWVGGSITVQAGAGVAYGASLNVLVQAKSESDALLLDAVKATTTKLRVGPDLWIRNSGDTSYVGDNVYNADGTNQTKGQMVATNVWATYEFRLYNDGTATESFRLTGPTAPSGWQVRYYITGQGEKTTDFTNGVGYLVSSLAPGAMVAGSVTVLPGAGVAGGAFWECLVMAKSTADANKLDAVMSRTTKGSGAPGRSPVLSSLTAASTRGGGAQITFSLSAPAAVKARIVNLAGRPIRTLCQDEACSAGRNTLLWNAHSDAGLRVPKGSYLVEVTVRGADGTTSRALQVVVIGR